MLAPPFDPVSPLDEPTFIPLFPFPDEARAVPTPEDSIDAESLSSFSPWLRPKLITPRPAFPNTPIAGLAILLAKPNPPLMELYKSMTPAEYPPIIACTKLGAEIIKLNAPK